MSEGTTQVPPQAVAASCHTGPSLSREMLDDLIMIVLSERSSAVELIGHKGCIDIYEVLDGMRSALEDPAYTHDCEECRFLGRHQARPKTQLYDLYVCQKAGGTVVARYGDDGPDYVSGLVAGKTGAHPALAHAYALARQAGYFG